MAIKVIRRRLELEVKRWKAGVRPRSVADAPFGPLGILVTAARKLLAAVGICFFRDWFLIWIPVGQRFASSA